MFDLCTQLHALKIIMATNSIACVLLCHCVYYLENFQQYTGKLFLDFEFSYAMKLIDRVGKIYALHFVLYIKVLVSDQLFTVFCFLL